MQDQPSPSAILGLAIAQLNAIDPQAGRAKFEMRMVTAALQLVQRALDLAPGAEAAEHQRLTALLNAEGDTESLNRRLCVLIRDGQLTLADASLAAHLRATTMEKLAVDQPTYASYRHALERSKG